MHTLLGARPPRGGTGTHLDARPMRHSRKSSMWAAVAATAVAGSCLLAPAAAAQSMTLTSPALGVNATVGTPFPIAWKVVNDDSNVDPAAQIALVIVSCPNNFVQVSRVWGGGGGGLWRGGGWGGAAFSRYFFSLWSSVLFLPHLLTPLFGTAATHPPMPSHGQRMHPNRAS